MWITKAERFLEFIKPLNTSTSKIPLPKAWKRYPFQAETPSPPPHPPRGKTPREKLVSLNVCEAVLQGTLQATSSFERREFSRETHTSLRLLIGRIIFVTHEKTSFAILIGCIIFFFAFCTKKLLKWKSLVFHCCLYNHYYIDTSVLLENIPLVKLIKTTSGTRVVYFP